MADYRRHSIINVLFFLPICLISLYLIFGPLIKLLATFAASFVYSTLFMSPDLDLAYKIKPLSLRGVLAFPFRMYARFFHHRGISHSFFLGSLSRIIWLSSFFVLGFFMAYFFIPEQYIGKMPNYSMFLCFVNQYKPFLYYGIGGLVAADYGHLLVDHETGKII